MAVSTQAHVSNRIWIGLVTVAVISFLPQAAASGEIPFGLGKVPATSFHLVVFALLIVLTIAFASAHAQQVRAQNLAYHFIDSLPSGFEVAGMHPRELLDMLRVPSVNRVAPLAQSLRLKYQFYKTKEACPTVLVFGTTVWYALLKAVGVIVYFGVPAFALVYNYMRIDESSFIWRVLMHFCGSIALLSLLQVLLTDLWYARVVCKVISRRNFDRPHAG